MPAELNQRTRGPQATSAVSDSEVDGDGPAQSSSPIVRARPSDARDQSDASSAHSASSTTSLASHSSSGSQADGNGLGIYPNEIMGVPVTIESHRKRTDQGLRVPCRNPDHTACNKYRSCKLHLGTFGPQAPVFFLKAWLAKAFDLSEKAHSEWKPSHKDIRDFLASEPNDA